MHVSTLMIVGFILSIHLVLGYVGLGSAHKDCTSDGNLAFHIFKCVTTPFLLASGVLAFIIWLYFKDWSKPFIVEWRFWKWFTGLHLKYEA